MLSSRPSPLPPRPQPLTTGRLPIMASLNGAVVSPPGDSLIRTFVRCQELICHGFELLPEGDNMKRAQSEESSMNCHQKNMSKGSTGMQGTGTSDANSKT